MRGWRAEPLRIEAAVDRMAFRSEEDRVRHRRVVPLLGEVVLLQAKRGVAAIRGIVLTGARGYRPSPAHPSIHRDRHALRRFVDGDENRGVPSGHHGGKRRSDAQEKANAMSENHYSPITNRPAAYHKIFEATLFRGSARIIAL